MAFRNLVSISKLGRGPSSKEALCDVQFELSMWQVAAGSDPGWDLRECASGSP